MRGLVGVKNIIRLFIVNQKKIVHRLDPLVAWFGNVGKKFDFDLCLTEKCVGGMMCGGLGWVRNKIHTYIINDKKKIHRLDPLFAWLGNAEKKLDFAAFWPDFDQKMRRRVDLWGVWVG